MHICVCDLTTIGSNNGLSPGRRLAIIWTIVWLLLVEPLRANFSEVVIEIHTFPLKKIQLEISSVKWHLFRTCLNVLRLKRLSSSSHPATLCLWTLYQESCARSRCQGACTNNYTLKDMWGVVTCPCCLMTHMPEQVSRARTSNYIPQYFREVTTCLCPWHLLQTPNYSCKSAN